MNLDRLAVNRLFIAIPELVYNINFVSTLRAMNLISPDLWAKIQRRQRIARKADKVLAASMKGDTLIKRLLGVAPELFSVEMVDLLAGVTWTKKSKVVRWWIQDDDLRYLDRYRTVSLISAPQAHMLRLAIRTLDTATRGGLPTDSSQIASRLFKVLGVNISNERINLWRSLGLISGGDAQRYQGYLLSGKVVGVSVVKALRAKKLLDALLMLGGIPIDSSFIDGLVKMGLMDMRTANSYKALISLGVKEWKVFEGTKMAEGYQRRLLIALTGSMNRQLLDLLFQTKVITGKQWAMMMPLEIISRRVNDRLLESLTKRKFRVKPGEAPIKTFARTSRVAEADLLRLLAEAAREASKEAQALAENDRIGSSTRSRQYRLAAAGLHQAMRSAWEGVGYLTIAGEARAAEAAAESAAAMQRALLTGRFAQLGDSLLWQSKAGIDSYISRSENTKQLSRRVYKNIDLHRGAVDKRIMLSLLQGRSPAEIARDVQRYMSPNVPGGVQYAARRLARTEINNAFHFSTIRYTRENPWVRGYKWNRSRSHGSPDECDRYATEDHDGLGEGVFKKSNVPDKPHPNCLCYLTTVQMSPSEFAAAHRAGRFTSYYKSVSSGDAFGEGPDQTRLSEILRLGLTFA